MYLSDLLFSQGFGTRRICAGLVQQGLVKIDTGSGLQLMDEDQDITPTDGMAYEVQGAHWQFHTKAYILLHKPAGTECSQYASSYGGCCPPGVQCSAGGTCSM